MLDPQSGAVTAVQRCGAALNVNVHFHTLIPDGVFVGGAELEGGEGAFRSLPPPSDDEIHRLVSRTRRRVLRLLRRRGLLDDGNIVLELPRVWADGTTHMLFEPNEFLERLVTLTPRPRINLTLT